MDVINSSLFEQEIKTEKICHQLGVSASTLYRNTVQLTGSSPNDFIREIRLLASLQMMQKQNKNINETSYGLGFTNPSYFTKCFKKRFSVLPAEFLKTLHDIAV
jgi:AraC-like DNA-binding protein